MVIENKFAMRVIPEDAWEELGLVRARARALIIERMGEPALREVVVRQYREAMGNVLDLD